MEKAEPITIEQFTNHIESYNKDPKNTILRHALSKTSIQDIVYSRDNHAKAYYAFSHTIKKLPVTNQIKIRSLLDFCSIRCIKRNNSKKIKFKRI